MRLPFSRKYLLLTIAIALIISGYFLLHSKPSPPETVSVKTGEITEQVIASGQIIPDHASQVKSQIPGVVGKLLIDEGDYVHKSQTLLIVNPNPAPTDYANAYGQVEQYQALTTQTKATYQRKLALFKQQGTFADDVDQARKDYETALAQLQQAHANLDLLSKGTANIAGQTIDNLIKSPIDGYVLSKTVNTGDTITPITAYQPGNTLFVIANMNELIFQGQVSQIDVGKLKAGMAADLQIAALPDVSLHGTIERISLQTVQQDSNTDQQSGSTSALFQQQSTIQNGFTITINGFKLPKDAILRAGYQATADIITKQVKHALILPESVIQDDGGKTYVWLVQEQNSPAHKQSVTLGASDATNVQILKGLKAGQKVLLMAPGQSES